MSTTDRSDCPINLAVEMIGDRWTLLLIRDIVFAGRRRFRELLLGSDEGITSSVLADRLERLTESGVLTREGDPSHKQKAVYTLTDKGIDLVPVLITVGQWGAAHGDADPAKVDVVARFASRTPDSWARFMQELRASHRASAAVAAVV